MIDETPVKSVDPAQVDRKRRNALEALGLYAEFLRHEGLKRPQTLLPSIASALAKGRDREGLEWWRRYEQAGLHERYVPLCRQRVRHAGRHGLDEQELRYHVLRGGVHRAMAHLRVYLDYRLERPLVDLSEASIRRLMDDQTDGIRRQARRQRARRGWTSLALLAAVALVAWIVL